MILIPIFPFAEDDLSISRHTFEEQGNCKFNVTFKSRHYNFNNLCTAESKCPTPQLTGPAHEAFNIIAADHNESHAPKRSDSMSY
jgi:hypothetical protein